MVDKVVAKLNTTRHNWWEAFKLGISIKGYKYYQPPPELKYRYPAPGSSPHSEVDHPHLFKKHWKTPYRESNYNIRNKEKAIPDDVMTEVSASSFPEFDPNEYYDQLILREMMPSYADKKDLYKEDNWINKSTEEKKEELWNLFESYPKITQAIKRDFAPYNFDLEDEYKPNHFIWRERGATGFENDPIMREIFVDLEYLIEEVIGA
jgi:hypothetical protein